ncbi:MAG: hypothetical protein Q9226_003103 [Calogaya cf. arnoldii]
MAYPPPQGGPPTSFKTNVNRAKTKRWVEAKSYSYDGDDWGEMDEYDEYGGYDEPPPPPEPTGLRQRGQSASRDQPSPTHPAGYEHPQQSQHQYGNLGRQPPMQPQYGARSATNPQYQQSQFQRSGSFDRGDERRAFSAAGPHQGPPPTSGMYQDAPYAQSPVPTPQYHQAGDYPDVQDRSFHQDRDYPQPVNNSPFPYSDQRQTSMGSRTQSMTSNNSANDLHSRRDFSPSAVPPPLHTRDSPSPQRPSEHQSASRPPRMSSLSQQNRPEQLYARQGSMPPVESDQEDRPGALRERAGSDVTKALPFVRPADIYRRMQEEKERERQSQESSRPSMDAIMANDRPKNDLRGDSVGASGGSRDFEHRDAPRSSINPVTEPKSEYNTSENPSDQMMFHEAPATQRQDVAEPERRGGPVGINTGLSPQLPDVARMSGFGELFASMPRKSEDSPATFAPQRDDTARFDSDQLSQDQSGSPLQHQPSLGFRSVVHQAFDTTNEPVPETPSSSTADSSIDRSGSGGTSAVSPIISRGPSSATANLNFRDPQIQPATPPAVGNRRNSADRPLSSGSLSTPKADTRRSSPDTADQRPARFMPGHRRDLSTPSPDNSPARTPALEANKQLQQPQEAELATTTPIETCFPHLYEQPVKPFSGRTSPAKSLNTAESSSPIKSSIEELPKSPAESTRSRVRNLADRFESGRSSPAGSERAPSPVKTSFVPNLATSQPRPLPADRLESFRPKLPGGWESSASIAPFPAPTRTEASSSPIPLEQRLQNTAADRPGPSNTLPKSTGGHAETQQPTASSPLQAQEVSPISDPFASLAAAGSALAGAFSTAIGSDNDDSNRDPSAESPVKDARQPNPSNEKEDQDREAPRILMDTNYVPEASKPMMLATSDDGTSSIMPTPLDKISQSGPSGDNRAADYFATSADRHQQMAVDSHATQDSASRKRPVLLPSLSTDYGSQYESDRLRREIIRELSPGLNSEPTTGESNSPLQDDSRGPNGPRQQHESLIIPREYDSYWNGSSSEKSSRASSVKGPSQASREVMQGYHEDPSTVSSALDAEKPLPICKEEAPRSQDEMLGRPELPPHRYSWEAASEHSTSKPPPLQSLPPPSPQNISDRDHGLDTSGASASLHRVIPSQQDVNMSDPARTSIAVGAPSVTGDNQRSMEPQGDSYASEAKRSMDSARSNPRAPAGDPTYRDQPGPGMIGSESSSTNGEPYQYQGVDPNVEFTESHTKPLGTTSDLPLPLMPPGVPPKIQSFREILSLKEPRDRIKGYNETREQFANMNTGLEHWLAITTTELSEHKEILPYGKLAGTPGAKPLTTRTKLSGLLPSSSSTQQPYFASSSSGAPDGAPVAGANTNQGYSPSSGSVKLSSQQMQARGKDLLHTAGLFSGKANVAAKGLFSKGKSRLRGANTDKAPTSSIVNQDPDSPTIQQASQTSPVTPKNDIFFEQSQSSNRPVSGKPESDINPSERRTDRTSSLGNQEPGQAPSLFPSSPDISSDSTAPSTSISTVIQAPAKHQSADLGPKQDSADRVPTAEQNKANVTDYQDASQDSSDGEPRHYGQMQSIERADLTTSNNRTPTQADYADYFRRGSSPTAIVPGTTGTGSRQKISDRETPNQQQSFQRDGLPALQSIYSNQTLHKVSDVNTIPTTTDRNQSSMGLENLQRGSEDSDGTFHTAGSTVGLDTTNTATGARQITQSADQQQPTEPSVASSVTRSSSGASSSITPPVAVPAANIRDQPRARPFSFIQFTQNPAPKPLEDYSHRRPSIESLPSRIDPEQDVPPSPISPQHSMIHEPNDRSGRRSPLNYGGGHDFSPNNGRPISSTPSRSFSRPFQEPRTQNLPALPHERSPTRGDDLPAQHYPAPMPRQDPVHPRQQSTEYSLAGVGPPQAPQSRPRPTESRSSSKRGSRSSAFFKSFRSPTESASPPLAGEREESEYTDRQDDPTMRKTKSKRSSLFRSLTGGTRSSRSEEVVQSQQDLVHPAQARPSYEKPPSQQTPVPVANTQEHTPTTANTMERTDTEIPSKMPGKYRNRLSRPAAPKEREPPPPEPGKKKRFSALGSLFGRSKDKRVSNTAENDRPQTNPERAIPEDSQQPKERTGRLSSLTKSGRGSAVSSEKPPGRDAPYQATRDQLAKEGLLAPKPRQSSKSPEPSAYSETSARQQQMFPARHQSMGQGAPRQEQRPSDRPRQFSSTSSIMQPPFMQAPDQRHRIQSTVTTRSNSRYPSGLQQPEQKTRQLSSFTTTTTTTTRGGKTFTSTRQDSLGNKFGRSESPPPPPPPPKDTCHSAQRSHQRSRGISNAQNPVDPPTQTSNNQQFHLSAQPANVSSPPPTQARTHSDQNYFSPAQSMGAVSPPTPQTHHQRVSPTPNHQSLPPLQTNISNSSSPAGPRPYSSNPDSDARKLRSSQIESSGTPRAESATIAGGFPITSDPEAARKYRRSQIESAGTHKPDSAGAPEVVPAGANKENNSSKGRKSEDEPIVMTATSFPGQEWQPTHGGWDEY